MKATNAVQSASDLLACAGRLLAALLVLFSSQLLLRADEHAHDHGGLNVAKALRPAASADGLPAKLPRLPKGVAELKFGEFFVKPVGPLGLEMTDKLCELNGQRVRILGYMAQEESPVPGRFLFAPIPTQINSHDNSLADDLPPGVVHVFPPTLRERIPHAPGLMLLTGTLSVGSRDEADGRVSLVRLALDPPEKVAKKNLRPAAKGAAGLMKVEEVFR
jgi:hypothetical protein